jgi:hypothetical protein
MDPYLYEQLLRIAQLYVVRLDENLDASGFSAREARRTKSVDTTEPGQRTTERRKKDRKRQNRHRGNGGTSRRQRLRADTSLGTVDRSDPDLSASNPDNRKD